MRLIRGIQSNSLAGGCVATIGNFDGVHRGHQLLFKQLRKSAEEHDLPTCVITFDPLPHEYFAKPELRQARLTHFREKFHALQHYGIDQLLLLRFNQQLASLPAEDFVKKTLIDRLQVKDLIVGDDFRFGYKRRGDFDCLKKLGLQYGFSVRPTSTFSMTGSRVSSTRIREHLINSELDEAAELLGRRYQMEGRVVYGRQLGRTLGYPTANISLKRHRTPLHGVFIVTAIDRQNRVFAGMASLGERPTVGAGETLLEVHLFDFNGNLYGQHLKIEFLKWLRAEEHFDSVETLIDAIKTDELRSRTYFQQFPV